MKKFKLVIALTFLFVSILGIIIFLSMLFDLELFNEDGYIFGRGVDGGASNTPIYLGLLSITKIYLLDKIDV